MERVSLEKKVLSENERIAAGLRARFREHGILCFNLISSPGSGKTSLLEKTLESLPQNERVGYSHRRHSNRQRRPAPGPLRLSGETDYNRRHLSSGRANDRAWS